MQVSKGHGDLSSEELSLLFGEFFDGDQMSEQLTSLDEVHQEVNSVVVLEHILHVDQEGMVNSVKNIFLKLDVLHLLVFDNNVLSDTLHCVQLACGLVLHEEDLTESTLANKFSELEVLEFSLNLGPCEDLLATACHGLSDLLVHLVAIEFGVFFIFILLEREVVIGVSLLVSDLLLLVEIISVLRSL